MTNEEKQNEKRAAAEEKVRYVEVLAPTDVYPEGDYLLTLTDAARVTKRQDKTVRDWVQQGKLAVRPAHLGLNKRTRQVRASDLAQLTPILDQAAAITTEAGQVYITSIPAEMQQIRSKHEDLLAEATRIQQEIQVQGQTFSQRLSEQQRQQQEALEALGTRWHQQHEQARVETQDTFERIGQRLTQHQDQQRQDLETLSSTWMERLDKVHESMYTLGERLGLRLDEYQREIQQLGADRDALRMTLERERQDREAFQAAIQQEMTAALARQDQERIQLQHDLQREIQVAEQRQQVMLEQQVQRITKHLETVQHAGEGVADRLTLVEQAIARQEQASQQQQIAQLTQDLQQLSALVQKTQRRSDRSHERGDEAD